MPIFLLALAALCAPVLSPAAIHANYTAVKETMRVLASRAAVHTSVIDLGVSDSGETIQALRIGNGPVKTLVVAAHHGNEYGSVEVALGFAADAVLNPLPDQTVFVVPVLNTAGFNKRSRWESNRGGARDPNRDYPGPCASEGPFALRSTKALADFVAREGIVTAATLHTYYPGVAYPWGLSTKDLETEHGDTFRRLAQLATVESRYPIGNGSDLIYPADGTFEDYVFWTHGVWSLLFELGYSHSPSEREIESMKQVNVPGIRRFLEQAPRSRAARHAFNGRCDLRLQALDRHDE